MMNLKLRIVVLFCISILVTPAYGVVTNGAQCKNFLSPALELRSNHFLFNDMLNEFRNPLNQRLSDFRLNAGAYEPGSRVHTYVRNVQNILMQCNQNCEGLRITSGTTQNSFSCANLNSLTVVQLAQIANEISNDAQPEEDPLEAPAGPESHFADVQAQLDGGLDGPSEHVDSPVEIVSHDDEGHESTSHADDSSKINSVLRYIDETETYYDYNPPTRNNITW